MPCKSKKKLTIFSPPLTHRSKSRQWSTASGPSTSGPSTSGPSTSGPSTSGPSTSRPSTSQPRSSLPSESRPSTRRLSTSRTSKRRPSAKKPTTTRQSKSRTSQVSIPAPRSHSRPIRDTNPPSRIICEYCEKIMTQPTQTPCCGKTACLKCLKNYIILNKKKCARCGAKVKDFKSLAPNHWIQEVLWILYMMYLYSML